MKSYKFEINPLPKPRMTKGDRANYRPVTQRYFAYANELKLLANIQGLHDLPGSIDRLVFYIQMPKSWSEKKKEHMDKKPHQQTPDLTNLCKAFEDIICKEDSHIYEYRSGLCKFWARQGQIHLFVNAEPA